MWWRSESTSASSRKVLLGGLAALLILVTLAPTAGAFAVMTQTNPPVTPPVGPPAYVGVLVTYAEDTYYSQCVPDFVVNVYPPGVAPDLSCPFPPPVPPAPPLPSEQSQDSQSSQPQGNETAGGP